MVWLLVLVAYSAPDGAVNWNGPWQLGRSNLSERRYASEAECRNSAIQIIGKIHEGMLAPIRYRCVGVPSTLPEDAPR